MRMVYSEVLMDHFENPRHAGCFDGPAENIGSGMVGSRETGGVLRLQIRVDDDGTIVDSRFQAYGPPALIAAGSWLANAVQGASLQESERLTQQSIVQALELPAVRIHCALLAEDALRAAIQDFRNKQRVYA